MCLQAATNPMNPRLPSRAITTPAAAGVNKLHAHSAVIVPVILDLVIPKLALAEVYVIDDV